MVDVSRATAYWTMAPGHGALRDELLPEPGEDEARVRTRHSAISRGTELLVHSGRVPAEIAEQSSPFQVSVSANVARIGFS